MPLDPLANSFHDYWQDREVLSLRYYGCQFKQLTGIKKQKVSLWVERKRVRQLDTQEKYAMPLRDTLIDYHERTYYEDENSTVRRVDLKRAFDRLRKAHGELICDAAGGIISKSEAASLLQRDKRAVCREVDKANAEAVELLKDYAPCLPANLQRKYQKSTSSL